MRILNLSMECYPVAKVGGLADVVGALPKYLNRIDGVESAVIMPWYNKPFVHQHQFETVFTGFIRQKNQLLEIEISKEQSQLLGFDLYLIKIPGLLDRDQPYGYWDESQQFLAFQHGVLHWLSEMKIRPDVLHCHDYHTGLVPFMIENCPEFSFLKGIKTIGTIHNGEYQGDMSWEMADYLPWFEGGNWGLLDWNGRINPLAAMLKCCHAFNAVSKGYMTELFDQLRGLESLVQHEHRKAFGILNGIDTGVWNPETDHYLDFHYNKETASEGKRKNKAALCAAYGLDPELPLFSFIGRFAGEKGADLLPEIVANSIRETFGGLNVMILGSGDQNIENQLFHLNQMFSNFALDLGYKEDLSHKIYAGSDFLLMPSRVEPCGLNQMYAMRYGAVPIVRYTGGLRDTVRDVSVGGGGVTFGSATANDAVHAMHRAMHIYNHDGLMGQLVQTNMSYDFSWEKSAMEYLELYAS